MKPMFVDDAARARMAGWFETFRAAIAVPTVARVVDTPHGKTHVLVAGPEDAPPLVVLHGALATSAHVLPELGSLVERRRVYAVDVLGQSVMSDDRRLDVADDSYGTWLAAVCAGLSLAKTTVFGVSWGGFVALKLAKVAPALIDALVLLVPAGVVTGSAWSGFTKVGWPMLTYRLAPSPKRLERLAAGLFTSDDARWTTYFGDAVRSYRMDMRIPPLVKPEDVAGYQGPVLVLGADEDVSFPGTALLARAKELFPRAEIELLARCKHCPPVDDAFRARTAERVETFLAGR